MISFFHPRGLVAQIFISGLLLFHSIAFAGGAGLNDTEPICKLHISNRWGGGQFDRRESARARAGYDYC